MKRIIFLFFGTILTGFIFASDLGKAISEGRMDQVKSILNSNPGLINVKDNQGWTPVIQALNEGKKEIAMELINRGADVSIGDNENTQPIHFAAMIGSTELFELIRSKGIDPEQKDDNGITPLFYSIQGKQPEMSKYLIENGANLKIVSNNQWSLLLYAVVFGQPETARLLITKKADVNMKNTDGFAPLHSAVSFGRTEIVKMLVENGARIEEKNDHGETPLFLARNPNTYDAAACLIEKGADVKQKDNIGSTALMSVCGRGSVNVAELLLKHGALINEMDSNGFTALNMAAFSRNPDQVSKFLIMNGADVNPVGCSHGKSCSCSPNHMTPLHSAAMNGQLEMTKNLVANGAKINIYNKNGYTPLLLAVKNGNSGVVKLLVENGAFLNQKDKNLGYTELLLASVLGNKELITYLLAKGADISITNNDGKTALDLAWYYGFKDIAYTLLAQGASDAKLKSLVNQPDPINEPLSEMEASVWFLGHSGWAIKTKNHFLIFDYNIDPRVKAPADSGLASGYIVPDDLKNEKVTVFASHRHGDHYSKDIFKWKESLPAINYVLCFNTPDAISDYTFIPIHENKTIDGIKASTVRSTDQDGGFLVEVDGLVIFHPGDLANGSDELAKAYTDEIDLVASKGMKIDLAFAPIRGCSIGQPAQVKKGVDYLIEKLHPALFIPMHAGSSTDTYARFADEVAAGFPNQNVQVVVNKGDHFLYKTGSGNDRTSL